MRSASLFLPLALWGCSSTPAGADAAIDRDAAPDTRDAPDALDVAERVDAYAADAAADVASDAGRETVLRVHYPAGSRSVSLRGASGPWTWTRGVPATAGADDTWTYRTADITEVTEWKPLLDDATWSRGPNYRVAPGTTVDVYPHFNTANGQVVRLFPSFRSTVLGNERTVWAYLPPTYLENARASFPVVYMQDGQNLFDPAQAFGGNEWEVDETVDRAAEDGSFPEVIVVAPSNSARRIYEYTPTRDAEVGDGGGLGDYLRFVADELRPEVDRMLRTRTGPQNTAIVGSSLGGLVAAYGGVRRAEVFGLVGAMSPSTWWDNELVIRDVMARGLTAPRALRVYLDNGDSGPSNDGVAPAGRLAVAYRGIGLVEGADFLHVVQMGATHSEVYWAQRLPGALRFLLGPGR